MTKNKCLSKTLTRYISYSKTMTKTTSKSYSESMTKS